MNRKSKGGGKNSKTKKDRSLVYHVVKIWTVCLLVAFCLLGGLAVKKVGIPVLSMYKEARETVEKSSKDTFKAQQTSIVYDKEGNEIKKLKQDKDVSYLSFDKIPDAAKLAIISIEDKNFTSHRGIDVEGVARAGLSLILHRGEITMGGSTITQQLARNIFLNYEQTYSRKIKEMFIAVALEQKYTKEEILEFYLNNVYFSNGYYGIESASEAYFNKKAEDLSISQIAFLCAIPNSPGRYDPYKHKDATMERRDRILQNMYKDGYISKEQYDKSVAEKIKVKRKKETETNDYAETYILKCAAEALMREQGFKFKNTFASKSEKKKYDEEYDELYSTCKKSLYTAGYRIYTSIDMEKQKELQESVSSQLSMFTDKTDDGVYKVQGAAVCIDNSTGKVAAIVGGREEDQEGYGLNRAFQSFRQPGSSIKPLLVYAPALEKGYTPYSTLDDSRMTGPNAVSNSGYSYLGPISLRRAVQKSSNVATYRLYEELGPETCLGYLEDLNFKGLDENDYKYNTTCLGGFTNGTTVVEMAAGYAALENDGEYRRPDCIVKITDASGNKVVGKNTGRKEVYSSNAARMMTDVLESCVSSPRGTAAGCKLDNNMPAACKTGTTSNYVDGWLCGYTPYYTTAVWVGMDVYKPVDNLKGNTYPAYIWKNFMNKAHEGLAAKDFDNNYLAQEKYKDYSTADKKATTEKKDDTEEKDEKEKDKENKNTKETEKKNEGTSKTTEKPKQETAPQPKPETKPPVNNSGEGSGQKEEQKEEPSKPEGGEEGGEKTPEE
ncbi:MAG: PBP1A family penicillin-binding protein [Eubacterium sp.]|nr:PBP1A family penicillin-binding protein [Eubacterium sp.]MDD7210145.1 PBP1A family penicillin-binding protein [Lachnospiraceae bacterium]MDY5498362.1 PBP1A family penicillin-binding protein [Anaerobutyricum sp.]